jgi:hypothetical protein
MLRNNPWNPPGTVDKVRDDLRRFMKDAERLRRRRQSGTGAVPPHGHLPPGPIAATGVTPRRSILLVIVAALMVLALLTILAIANYGSSADGSHAITGVTTSWTHVRAGPGTAYPIIDTLQPNRTLQIQCRTGTADDPWDRLASPYGGRYVGATLIRSPLPPSCATG